MEQFKIDWSPLIRELLIKEVEELNELKSLVSKSILTDNEALKFSRRANKALAEKSKNLAIKK